MDLAIRSGDVVTAGSRFQGDVGVAGGRIVQLGGEVPRAATEIDASGKLVLPGGVDMHVHLSPAYVPAGVGPGGVGAGDEAVETAVGWADDFASGSRAAAAGGITTIGNMAFPRLGEGPLAAARRVAGDAARESIVDFVMHPVLLGAGPEVAADIPRLAADGYVSIKMFLMFETFDAHVRDHVGVMDLAGQHGLVTLLHCEDACVVSVLAEKLLASGASDASHYGEARPAYAEAVSVARAVAFSEATGAPIYLVHVSSADALEVAHRAKARGVAVTVETRPIYLFFDEDRLQGPDAGLYIGNPPLRAREHVNALWGGLRTGAVDTCCTDHAPAPRAEKLDPSRTIATVSPGMGELDTLMPLLFSEGVRTDRITLERFVELTSTNAARAFGLYPRKGTIAVGSDADLLVWDPEASRTFSAESAESNADFSLYEGWEITGWPEITISRGDVIHRDGEITAPHARGRLVTRA